MTKTQPLLSRKSVQLGRQTNKPTMTIHIFTGLLLVQTSTPPLLPSPGKIGVNIVMLPIWVLGLSSQQKLRRGQMRISSKALLWFMLQHKGMKTSNRCPCWLPRRMGWFLKRGEGGRQVHGLGWSGDLRGLPTPLVVLCAGIMPSVLFLFLPPQKQQLVCGVCTLLFMIFSDCTSQLFLVPQSFFVFCCGRSPLSRCKQVKCPRSQAVLVIVMVFVDIFTMYKHVQASLITQLVQIPSAMQETPVQFLGLEDQLEKGQAMTLVFLGFSGGSAGKESACNEGDLGLIPGLRRSPGEGKGYPIQYSGLENSTD